MARTAVKDALASAIARADEDVARAHVAQAGLLTRLTARRSLERTLERARALTDRLDGLDDVGRRVATLQLAWLIAADRAGDASPLTAERVAKAYYDARDADDAALPTPEAAAGAPSTGATRPLLIGLGVALVLGAAAFLASGGLSEPDPRDAPMGRALSDGLTDWVIALDRWAPLAAEGLPEARLEHTRTALDAARAALFVHAENELGDARPALEALLDATEQLARTSFELDADPAAINAAMEAADAPFRAALRDANLALAERGLPWFLDGDFTIHRRGYAQTVLFGFHVVRHSRLAARTPGEDPVPVEVLHLRRVDRVGWSQGLLGYTRESMDVAVVLEDKVEDDLVTFVGPTLANDEPMPLFEGRTAGTSWKILVEDEAGRVAREAFAHALPDEVDAMRALGDALQARRSLFERWGDRLGRKGVSLRTPGSIAIPDDLYDMLKESLPDFQVDALADVQRRVESAENLAIFAQMLVKHARSVERHEAQHRLDYALGDRFVIPPALREAIVGEGADADAMQQRRVRHAAFELSAYLSEIARDPAWSKLNLTLLARHAIASRGSGEHYAAVIAMEGLADVLALDEVVRVDGRVVPRRAGELYIRLMDSEPAALADAATRLWKRLFHADLPPLGPASE